MRRGLRRSGFIRRLGIEVAGVVAFVQYKATPTRSVPLGLIVKLAPGWKLMAAAPLVVVPMESSPLPPVAELLL
jgi:hypothetical protein